jgi:hypothetical protein
MPSPAMSEEVRILRFFETGSIEKVEAVFNIVCAKMRERRCGRPAADRPRAAGASRKRESRVLVEDVPAENSV